MKVKPALSENGRSVVNAMHKAAEYFRDNTEFLMFRTGVLDSKEAEDMINTYLDFITFLKDRVEMEYIVALKRN